MRLVRELERMDEEAQITVPKLLSKLEKLMAAFVTVWLLSSCNYLISLWLTMESL